ncbi:MAG: hypothetical protein O2812_04740 [Chloroflexi bacterium]|nr:hypothetical protein [Chloroflexota bacterium]
MAAMTQETLQTVIAETIAAHGAEVERWLVREPGAWGFLAGKAVISMRLKLGRRLVDEERRTIWATLWDSLQGIAVGRI